MTMFEPPDPDDVLADLAPLSPTLYRALEAGTSEARGFFDARQEPYEKFQFSGTTRYVAKRFLEKAGIDLEFEPEDIPNNGLYLIFRGYPLRIRKRFNGGVAAPGSRTLQAIHAQTFGWGDYRAIRPNLFILWEIVLPTFHLDEHLLVACPKETDAKYPALADCHWVVPLRNVALTGPVMPPTPDESDTEDLNIYRPFEDTGTDTGR